MMDKTQNMKILQINKNDADLPKRIDQLNHILFTHKPQFLIINELQKHKYDNTSKFQFPGYHLESDKLDKLDGWSRTGILIKSNINYKRRHDLETPGISSVWLQVGQPGAKQFLLQGVYRQFQRLGRDGSKSQPNQQARWNEIITKWEKAVSEGREVLTLGDMNIDSISWEKNWDEMPQFEKQKQKMYKQLKDRILSNGTVKINSEVTHFDNQPGGRDTCLDHMYTTNPEKINSHRTHHKTFSDHSMIELNKRCQKLKNEVKFLKMRSMKNFDGLKFKENLKNHKNFIEVLYHTEPEEIVSGITEMIQDSLQVIAPVKRIQLNSKKM